MQTRYNWKARREKQSFLALEDGTLYRGYSVGADTDSLGEVVFNTGMTGYQEIISDPSYNGQLVTMTYTEIGNTGTNLQDMESRRCFATGFIVHELNEPSNFRAEDSLGRFLAANAIPAIAGIDTRRLDRPWTLAEVGIGRGLQRGLGVTGWADGQQGYQHGQSYGNESESFSQH